MLLIKAALRSIRAWFSRSPGKNARPSVQSGSICSNCGLELLGEPDGVPIEDREPCPQCGGRARTFGVLADIKIGSDLTISGTSIHSIDSASKYYTEILKPEYAEFFLEPATLRSAFGLASLLFHYHEWLFEYHKSALEKHFRRSIPTKGDFWGEVEAVDTRFGYIRDVANSSKHVRITRRPSTSMTHVANTSIHVGAFNSEFDRSVFDSSKVKMKDGALDVDFDDCSRALFTYWTNLSKTIEVIT